MNNQTLLELLTQRVEAFAASDRPREIIDKHTEAMFEEVIRDQFRSFGGMGKAVKAAVEEALPGNLTEGFELIRYNTLITNAVRERWASSGVSVDLVNQATKALDEVVTELVIPERVRLSDILNAFVEAHTDEAMESGWDAPTIRFSDSDVVDGYHHVYFDKNPEKDTRYGRQRSNFDLDNVIHISANGNDVDEDGNAVGEVYSARVDGDVVGRKFVKYYSKHEQLIVALFYGNAKIVMDCDADDFYYPGHD